ncbi:hypothetical protein [Clostridium sp. Marseille-Q2269]|uniref:hypothetical protein n=1 Tax=Clostridium sp. Marseille-Q2269 TaxID=2942205 RepID=UPI002073EA61|nr:hypothetical protein [Clostridium sp. Marseille-Q2269]
MKYVVAQYILMAILIIAIGYFLYLIRSKNENHMENYYGLSDIIIDSNGEDTKNRENIKIILRAIGDSVRDVEKNYKLEPNNVKEDKALDTAERLLQEYKLKGKINENALIYLIRINCALMNETHK